MPSSLRTVNTISVVACPTWTFAGLGILQSLREGKVVIRNPKGPDDTFLLSRAIIFLFSVRQLCSVLKSTIVGGETQVRGCGGNGA